MVVAKVSALAVVVASLFDYKHTSVTWKTASSL